MLINSVYNNTPRCISYYIRENNFKFLGSVNYVDSFFILGIAHVMIQCESVIHERN